MAPTLIPTREPLYRIDPSRPELCSTRTCRNPVYELAWVDGEWRAKCPKCAGRTTNSRPVGSATRTDDDDDAEESDDGTESQ